MPQSFKTISEALAQPKSRYFGVVYENGRYAANDELSFFGRKLPDPELTFDIANNKTLVNVNMNGSIKFVTVYNGQYASDNIPGVWMCKDFRKTGPYAFALKLGEQRYDLGRDDLPYTTSLLDNLFPVTEYRLGDVQATLLTYAPVSADGTARLRGAVYGLHVENRSEQDVDGEVMLPRADTEEGRLFSGPDFCVHPVDMDGWNTVDGSVPFHLAPGQSVWVPAVIYPPGDRTLQLIDEKGSLYWLNETWAYFRGMLGRLEMRDDPFAAEFHERSILQCLGSIAMARQGAVVGSNWGTYPTTEFTWNKDMYYSFLPLHTVEPELFKQGMLWFLEHGVRPAGNGPFGFQYTEGTSAGSNALKDDVSKYAGKYADFGMQFIGNLTSGGFIDLFHHDGEESDTILMPLYGYAAYDDPAYRHYMQFSLSPHNPTYNPESRGIQWGDHAACTFPGYMSGMGMITDYTFLSGTDGYFRQIRQLTDADGSLWWWPYLNGARYGDVVRHHNCGKCGWASGVFSGLFVSQILGISYDAPARRLSFRPLRAAGSFAWEDVRLGSGVFNLSYRQEGNVTEAIAANFNAQAVTVYVELPCEQAASTRAFVNGKPAIGSVEKGYHNGNETVIFKTHCSPGKANLLSSRAPFPPNRT